MPNAAIEPLTSEAEADQLAEELDRFQEARLFLSQQRARLTRKYPNEWLAVHRRDVVAHSPRLSDVEREMRRLGIHRSHVLLEFLTTERQSFIL